jgi:hypothetical protein
MAFNFSLGRDSTVVVTAGDGTRVDIQAVNDFERKQDVTEVKVDVLDGDRHRYDAPMGWSGGFTSTRKNQNFDQFWAAYERNWHQNGTKELFTITVFTNESDGSTTTEQYVDCTLMYSDAGKLAADNKPVELKVTFKARRRSI